MDTVKSPKYDNDLVNLGYLNKRLEDEDKNNSTKFNTISKTYSSPPIPPYYSGSLLFMDKKVYRCIRTRLAGSFSLLDWKIVVSTDEVDEALKIIYDVNKLEYVNQVDGLIETFFQKDDPALNWTTDIIKNEHVSDLWTIDNITQFQYTKLATNPVSYSWKEVSVPSSLFDENDGYKKFFLQEPTDYSVDDLWLDTEVKIAIKSSNIYIADDWKIRDDFIQSSKAEQEEYHKIYMLPKITEINRYTITEIKKAIDEITLTVSQTYTTKTEVEQYIDDVKTGVAEEYTTKEEMNGQIAITSNQINSVVEKTTIQDETLNILNQSYSKISQKTDELDLKFQKIGGVNLFPNSSGQNGTNGYLRNMMKPYIEIDLTKEELPLNNPIKVTDWAFDISNSKWYQWGYDGSFSLVFQWNEVTTMPSEYIDDEQWKLYLIDKYNNIPINSSDFSNCIDFKSIENKEVVSNYNFVFFINRNNTYDDVKTNISLTPFDIPKIDTDSLYFNFRYKNKITYGNFIIEIYQLDGNFQDYGYDNTKEYINDHILQSDIFDIPNDIQQNNDWKKLNYKISFNKKTTQIYIRLITIGSFDNLPPYATKNYILKRNPILEKFNYNEFYLSTEEVSTDLGDLCLLKSIFREVRLNYFLSLEKPTVPEYPDFSQLWLVEEDIYVNNQLKYEKDKLYTYNCAIQDWVSTDYTKEEIDKGVKIVFFDCWEEVVRGFSTSAFHSIFKGTVEIADCMLSFTDTEWQPAQGENFWGRNIKISGKDGIFMTNEIDGYTRIINEREDISKDKQGNINWALTQDGDIVNNHIVKGKFYYGNLVKVPGLDGVRTYIIREDK